MHRQVVLELPHCRTRIAAHERPARAAADNLLEKDRRPNLCTAERGAPWETRRPPPSGPAAASAASSPGGAARSWSSSSWPAVPTRFTVFADDSRASCDSLGAAAVRFFPHGRLDLVRVEVW